MTRVHAVYDWTRPATALLGVVLMEFGDFAMMRRMLLGIRERAEEHVSRHQHRAQRATTHVTDGGPEELSPTLGSRPRAAEVPSGACTTRVVAPRSPRGGSHPQPGS